MCTPANIRWQISEHIFVPNGGYCLYIIARNGGYCVCYFHVFFALRSILKCEEHHSDIPRPQFQQF